MTTKIVYVGLKEQKADNVAGTGLIWKRGEIHEVDDEAKAAKLLAHPLIWQDASKKYELLPEPAVVKPEPRVSIIPNGEVSPYWEPIVIPVPSEVFTRLQKKELVSVFMTPEDADAYAEWKLHTPQPDNTVPKQTGPAVDKRSKAYKDSLAGLEKKSA
jgi:hypothetical protein